MNTPRELTRREQLIAILRHGGAMTDEIADLVTDKFAAEVRTEQAAEIDRLRAELAERKVEIEKLQGLHTCPALATNLDRCCKSPGHTGDHSSFAGRHIWSPAHAAEAARLHHCTAEYGGPGYSHCELAAGHDGQHEAAMGNMRRATWGGEL
jgi:hypothetical protein